MGKPAHTRVEPGDERFRILVQNSSDIITIHDADGTIRYESPSAARILGYAPGWLIGKNPFELIHPNDVSSVQSAFTQVAQRTNPGIPTEFRLRKADGSFIALEGLGSNLLDHPEINGIVITARDVSARKQAQLAFLQSEERYRSLVETSPDAIVMYDLQGNFLAVNQRTAEIYGVETPDDFLLEVSNINVLLDETGRQYTAKNFQNTLQTGISEKHEYTLYLKKNRILQVEINSSVVRNIDGKPTAFISVVRDITERKMAEKALLESEEKYRNIVEKSIDGIMLIDENGILIEWNEGMERLSGYKRDEILGRHGYDVMLQVAPAEIKNQNPHRYDELRTIFEQFSRTGQTPWLGNTIEVKIQHASGEIRTVQEITFAIETTEGFMQGGVFRDITESKRAEQALRESETRLRFITDNMLDMVTQIDPDRMILYASPSIKRLLGYEPDDIVGKSVLEFIHSDDLRKIEQVFQSAVKENRPSITLEYRCQNFSGEFLWLESIVNLLYDDDGKFTGGIFGSRDITERKYHERELETLAAVSTAIRATSTQVEMMTIILDQLTDLFNLDGAAMAIVDPATNQVAVKLGRDEFEGISELANAEEEITRMVISQKEPFLINNTRTEPLSIQLKDFSGVQSIASFPLRAHDQNIGVLIIGRGKFRPTDQGAFSPDEVRAIQATAEMAANALQRTALHEQTARQAKQLAAVNALGRALAETLDLPQVYERLYQATIQLLPDIATFFISLYNPQSQTITCAYAFQDGIFVNPAELPVIRLSPEGQGIQSQVIHSRTPLIVDDLPERVKDTKSTIIVGDPSRVTQSALYVPLLTREQVIGVIQVQSYTPHRFRPEDRDLLTLVANTAAVAIENARLFDETQRRLNQVLALRDIDTAITASLDIQVTLNVMLEHLINQLGVDAASILLYLSHLHRLEFAAARGFRTRQIEHLNFQLGEGFAGKAALDRRILHISDISISEEKNKFTAMWNEEGFNTYIGVPLIARGDVKGVLEIYHRLPIEPDVEWMGFLETLAGQAAIAIDNAQLFNNLQRVNLELSMAYDEAIEGWSRALDLRDRETEGHTQRVSEIAVRLAQEMGMSPIDLVHVRRGALLHDIGKMAIPDNILLKPDKLSTVEWNIMHQHPVFAFEMLSPITYLKQAIDIPYCHHEKWDGTGYPRGLAKEQIPLAARVFAVVDVWDALRSDRPYRPAWPDSKVREYILSQSGIHFDPRIVETFLKIIDEINP